jgi:hypothetical protein
LFFPFLVFSLLVRFKDRDMIGIGPLPLINNVYHKKALEKYG